ncbi:hypothetical protein OIO90_000764 [Microbotryomycetes sp. JL221]|nr:hypothetical protein OIO90_000764 [Microbotryomycetes sp. JL221]
MLIYKRSSSPQLKELVAHEDDIDMLSPSLSDPVTPRSNKSATTLKSIRATVSTAMPAMSSSTKATTRLNLERDASRSNHHDDQTYHSNKRKRTEIDVRNIITSQDTRRTTHKLAVTSSKPPVASGPTPSLSPQLTSRALVASKMTTNDRRHVKSRPCSQLDHDGDDDPDRIQLQRTDRLKRQALPLDEPRKSVLASTTARKISVKGKTPHRLIDVPALGADKHVEEQDDDDDDDEEQSCPPFGRPQTNKRAQSTGKRNTQDEIVRTSPNRLLEHAKAKQQSRPRRATHDDNDSQLVARPTTRSTRSPQNLSLRQKRKLTDDESPAEDRRHHSRPSPQRNSVDLNNDDYVSRHNVTRPEPSFEPTEQLSKQVPTIAEFVRSLPIPLEHVIPTFNSLGLSSSTDLLALASDTVAGHNARKAILDQVSRMNQTGLSVWQRVVFEEELKVASQNWTVSSKQVDTNNPRQQRSSSSSNPLSHETDRDLSIPVQTDVMLNQSRRRQEQRENSIQTPQSFKSTTDQHRDWLDSIAAPPMHGTW